MAKKRRLSDLIGEETQQNESIEYESSTAKIPDLQSNEVPDLQTNEVPDLQSNEVLDLQSNRVTESQTEIVPKYLTLVRKEARLREDQLNNLTSLTRTLNRKRQSTGERITENTLIRVAIDLLLDRSKELFGTTEQEIKKSVGLEITD